MRRTELVGDGTVVLAARVHVADQERDRGAGAAAFVHAGQDFDLIGLAPLRGVARAPGGAAREIGVEVVRRKRQPGRAAVDHAADRRAVGLAEGGDAKEPAKRVHARASASARMRA